MEVRCYDPPFPIDTTVFRTCVATLCLFLAVFFVWCYALTLRRKGRPVRGIFGLVFGIALFLEIL
jgi:hypothetical protein